MALLGQIDAITAIPDYYTELLYAALLGIIVAIDAPGLREDLDRLKARTRTRRADRAIDTDARTEQGTYA